MLAKSQPEELFASTATVPTIAEPVIAYVLANFAESVTLDDLAREAGLSRFNFCRRFHRDCGLSPMRWLWTFRIALAAELISLDPRWSLTEVAFACGFASSAHFSRAFRTAFGRSPSQYRKGALVARDGGRRGAESGLDKASSNTAAALRTMTATLKSSASALRSAPT